MKNKLTFKIDFLKNNLVWKREATIIRKYMSSSLSSICGKVETYMSSGVEVCMSSGVETCLLNRAKGLFRYLSFGKNDTANTRTIFNWKLHFSTPLEMLFLKLSIVTFFLLTTFSFAQSVEFFGKAEPGGLLFGKAENIKAVLLDTNKIDFSEQGIFVIGFDRDDTSSYRLIVKTENSTYLKRIILPKRKYKIQRINRMKQKYVSPSEAVLDRIVRERKITKAAKEKIGEVKDALFIEGFERPIAGGRISSVFGSQRILNGVPKNAHNGIDIAVPRGTPVKAMADGKVLLTADNFFYAGNNIIIDHGLGLNSLYLHLNEILVKEGQLVRKGEVIGKVGTTGRSTGPHLHWGVQWFGKRVDPNSIFSFEENE